MDPTRRNFISNSAFVAGTLATTLAPGAALAAADTTPASSQRLSKGEKLRALLASPGLIVAAQCLNAEHAAIAQHVGHNCIYIGGSVMARTHFMLDDIGMMLPNEMAEIAGRIGANVDIPLITDIDQGGETPLNTYRTTRLLCQLGVAGAHFEDSANPKHIGGQGDTSMNRSLSIDEMTLRLAGAVEGRAKESSAEFVIIARTDGLWSASRGSADDKKRAEEEVIKRGIAYAKAGADVFMPWDITPEQTERISREVPIPLCAGGNLQAMRKSKLKIYLALNNTKMLLDYFEATMRDLKEHDDFAHSNFNIPKGSYRQQQYSGFADMQKLGMAWARIRENVCKLYRT